MNNVMEPLIHEISSGNLETKFGKFKIYYFSDGREDAVALVKGKSLDGERDVLCRIHSQCFFAEAFYSVECDCLEQMGFALEAIQAQGGILIYLFQNGRGYGLAPMIATQDLKEEGMNQQEAYEYRGFWGIERSFDIAAKILGYFNVKSVRLITKNKAKYKCLKKYGINVYDAGLNPPVVIFDKRTVHQVGDQQIEIVPITNYTVVIVSDLNIDTIYYLPDGNGCLSDFYEEIKTGGCAFNSAYNFKKERLDPVVIGSIGDDTEGRLIVEDLKKKEIKALIYVSNRATGKSRIFYGNGSREILSESENANEYDRRIATMIDSMPLKDNNIIYLTAHMLIRGTKENVCSIMNAVYNSGVRIVIDIVPHNIYNVITWDFLCEMFDRPLFMVICELKTILAFFPELNCTVGNDDIVDAQIFKKVLDKVQSSGLNMEYFVLRYGYQNIGKQRVYKRSNGDFAICVDEETGFKKVKAEERCGFGEVLTVRLLKKYHYKESKND